LGLPLLIRPTAGRRLRVQRPSSRNGCCDKPHKLRWKTAAFLNTHALIF